VGKVEREKWKQIKWLNVHLIRVELAVQ